MLQSMSWKQVMIARVGGKIAHPKTICRCLEILIDQLIHQLQPTNHTNPPHPSLNNFEQIVWPTFSIYHALQDQHASTTPSLDCRRRDGQQNWDQVAAVEGSGSGECGSEEGGSSRSLQRSTWADWYTECRELNSSPLVSTKSIPAATHWPNWQSSWRESERTFLDILAEPVVLGQQLQEGKNNGPERKARLVEHLISDCMVQISSITFDI